MRDALTDAVPSGGGNGRPSPLDSVVARFPVGRVHAIRSLVATTGAAVLADYERDDAVRGTWFSEQLHFFDMTLSRRPAGARGRFEESAGRARPVGPILFVPAGYHYRGEGGRGRQKSLALFLERAGDDDLLGSVAGSLDSCVSLAADRVRELMLRIAAEVASPGFASAMLLEGLSLGLLVETARVLRGEAEAPIRKGGLAPGDMRTIRVRVAEGSAPPSLAELAGLCRMSRRQLVRAFRAETGGTIGAYVRQATIDRAKRMLAETDLPIGTVASTVGFAHPPAFSIAFRRACGRSPREYRASRRGTA